MRKTHIGVDDASFLLQFFLSEKNANRFVVVKAAGFIEGMAKVMGVPIETVRVAYRELRTDGLLTSGARGVNAPDMVPLDAARMLIWGLVSDRPVDAVRVVRDFGSIPFEKTWRRTELMPPVDEGFIAGADTFERAVAILIQLLADDDESVDPLDYAAIEVQSPDMICAIELNGTGFNFVHPFDHDNPRQAVGDRSERAAPYERNIKQTRSLGLSLIDEMAQMFLPSKAEG